LASLLSYRNELHTPNPNLKYPVQGQLPLC
jgi:hypothetical protein